MKRTNNNTYAQAIPFQPIDAINPKLRHSQSRVNHCMIFSSLPEEQSYWSVISWRKSFHGFWDSLLIFSRRKKKRPSTVQSKRNSQKKPWDAASEDMQLLEISALWFLRKRIVLKFLFETCSVVVNHGLKFNTIITIPYVASPESTITVLTLAKWKERKYSVVSTQCSTLAKTKGPKMNKWTMLMPNSEVETLQRLVASVSVFILGLLAEWLYRHRCNGWCGRIQWVQHSRVHDTDESSNDKEGCSSCISKVKGFFLPDRPCRTNISRTRVIRIILECVSYVVFECEAREFQ